jgi:hypothetical protein
VHAGALVSQQFNSSASTFDLTVTTQFVVPAAGDNGTLSVTLAALELRRKQQVNNNMQLLFLPSVCWHAHCKHLLVA